MFLIQTSTSHYDSTVSRQITCDTQKLYGHGSTMHPPPPKKKNYMGGKKRHYFPTDSHVQQNFQLPPCSPLLIASISDLFLCLHHQGIDILVTLCAIPSTISGWWSKQPEDWIHPKSTVFLMAAIIFSSTECVCEQHLSSYHPTQLQKHLQSLTFFSEG